MTDAAPGRRLTDQGKERKQQLVDQAAILFADLEASSSLARRLSTAGYFAVGEFDRDVWWAFLAALPLTPSGKVDRRALPAPALTVALSGTGITAYIGRSLIDMLRDVRSGR